MATKETKILITGATGFLGGRLARKLVDEGYSVRALARNGSNTSALEKLGVEIMHGNVVDSASVADAVSGIDVVVHAAAGTRGTAQDSTDATVQGTRNILDACKTGRVKQLMYMSSCSVYELANHPESELVTEDARLERLPSRRGQYSAAKQNAELQVVQAMGQSNVPIVTFRPGTMYGPGAKLFGGMIGLELGGKIFLVFGDGRSELPLVHVDNVVDAIVESIGNPLTYNQVFNVVDPDRVTKKMFMERVVKPAYPNARVVYFPMPLLLAATWLQEKIAGILGRTPILTVYRLITSQRRVRYSTSKIERAIGWRPRMDFERAIRQLAEDQGLTAGKA